MTVTDITATKATKQKQRRQKQQQTTRQLKIGYTRRQLGRTGMKPDLPD